MRHLLAAVVIVALAICCIGCGANSSVSEDDMISKEKEIEAATEKFLDGEIPEDEKRG